MTRELTDTEFKNTFGKKMTDVSKTAKPVADIWEYVKELVEQKLVVEYVYENYLVETVYRNDTDTFDHVLLPTRNQNVFMVIVIDLKKKTLFGHKLLDLNKEFGLSKSS